MSLRSFIREQREAIIVEFAGFARTLMPEGAEMTAAKLRDHADELLDELLADLETAQSVSEQRRKSQGQGSAHAMRLSAALHASARLHHGFSLTSVLAEFRALRASILRLYEESGASDLTDVRRFNEAIDEALADSLGQYVTQLDRFRDQFVGILGHDLRSPLSTIVTGAALLALPEDNSERRARVATRMLSSAHRMERLITDLLDLTRARMGGTIPLNRSAVDLHQLCEEVALDIGVALPQATVQLGFTGDVRGHWDRDRLAQVISNLVGNAIQHGDGAPITVTGHTEGDAVVLAVHNGGPPISPLVLPSIFEPLARGITDTSRSLGLGLFIARLIVIAHGGDIEVHSSSAEGTTFTTRLPRTPPTSAE
jgi:signal transduction histidine kinase